MEAEDVFETRRILKVRVNFNPERSDDRINVLDVAAKAPHRHVKHADMEPRVQCLIPDPEIRDSSRVLPGSEVM